MTEAPKFHDESLMPIIMGSPFRVPDYAYLSYGLKFTNKESANKAYQAEWAAGNKDQVALVGQALAQAGFKNFNEILQRDTARTVSKITHCSLLEDTVTIADIGAGPGGSALAIIKALPEEIKQQTTMLLVDPSKESLASAGQLMENEGVKYELFTGMDIEVLKNWPDKSVDILTGVASVHHHAEIPFDEYTRVLKDGGSAVFADWHHDLWEHPARVLKFLGRFDWPQKEQGLADWIATYPEALNNPDANFTATPAELAAREQITRFWLAYKNITDGANLGRNAIWPLEGHRPVRWYIEGMRKAGLVTAPPYKLLPESGLLQISMGLKIAV